MIHIQPILRTAHNLYKNVSLTLFGSNNNSYTVYTQSDVYLYTYCAQYRDAGQAKE
jgi:hypothetical protein